MLTAIDLFCGAGGFSLGMRWAGIRIIQAIDNWEIACKTYRVNHPETETICADIRNLNNFPEVDIVFGSPPCQDLSHANNKRKMDTSLIKEFLRVIDIVRPHFWVMENVYYARHIYKKLGINYQIIDARDCGLPQSRKRIFGGNFPLIMLPQVIQEVVPCITATEYKGSKTDKRRASRYFGRKLLIDEAKYYQGFPAHYYFAGNKKEQYIQIGNAVPPIMGEIIGRAIIKLNEKKESIRLKNE